MRHGSEFGTTVLRLALGVVFAAHGLAKVFVFTIPGTMSFFESVGTPGWTALPVTAVELLGGVMLLAGLGTRWAALALLPVAVGATGAHGSNGWMFTNAGGGWEFTAFLAAVGVALFLHGRDGRLAVGNLLAARRECSGEAPAQRRRATSHAG